MGEDHENTKRILQNIVNHPNAGGVLILGLGCENNAEIYKEMKNDKRTETSISALCVGLKCGGSDGFRELRQIRFLVNFQIILPMSEALLY